MPIKTLPSVIIGSGGSKNITNNIFISDFGNTIITGYLTVDYYLTVDGNLTVGGNFNLSGAITSDIIVKDGSSNTVFSVDSATGDTIVVGNFTVNGTTTTIDTTTLVVEDPVLTLAKNASGSPTASTDTGLFLQRGSTENPAIIIWNETLNQFELATVTGASSTTTNFSGVGIVKTYSKFKAGDMYGNSLYLDTLLDSPTVFTNNLYVYENILDIDGLHLNDGSNLNIKTTNLSSIILNREVTSGTPSSNAVIEVKRGSSTSALITWNEVNDRWDYNQSLNLTSGGFSINTTSFTVASTGITTIGTSGYLQIYKASSGGKNAIILNADASGVPTSDQTASIIVSRGSSPSASITWSEQYTRWQIDSVYTSGNLQVLGTSGFTGDLTLGNTTQILVATPSVSSDPVILLNSNQTGSPTSSVIAIEVERGSSTNSYIQWNEGTDTWVISNSVNVAETLTTVISESNYINLNSFGEVPNDDVAFTLKNESIATSLAIYGSGKIETNESISIKKGSTDKTVLLLNSDETGTPSKSATIEVERGTDTNSYIKWDEANDRWDFNFGLYLNTNSQIKIEKPSSVDTPVILLNSDESGLGTSVRAIEVELGFTSNAILKFDANISAGYKWDFNYPIKIAKPTTTAISAILLNYDEASSGTDVLAIEVERGSSPNSYIKWDETNDSWYLSHDLVLPKQKGITFNIDETSNPTINAGITVERGNYVNKSLYWNETDDHWDIDGHFNLGHSRRTRYYVYIRTASPVSAQLNSYFYFYTLDGDIHRACELSIKNTSVIISTSYSSGQDNFTKYSLNSTVHQPTLPGQVLCIASFDVPEGSTIYFKEYLNSGMDYLYVSRASSHYFIIPGGYITLGAFNNNIQITPDSNTLTNVTHTASYVSQEYNYQVSEIYRSVSFKGSIDFNPTTVTVTDTNQVIGVGGENMIIIVPSGVTSCYLAPSFTNGKVIRVYNYSTSNFTLNIIPVGHNSITYHFDINNASLTISRETTTQLLWYIDGSGNGHWLAN